MSNLKEILEKALREQVSRKDVLTPTINAYRDAVVSLQQDVINLVQGTPITNQVSQLPFDIYGNLVTIPGLQLTGPNGSVFMIWPGISPGGQNPSETKFMLTLGSNRSQDIVPVSIAYDASSRVWRDARVDTLKGLLSAHLPGVTSEQIQKAVVFCFTGIKP